MKATDVNITYNEIEVCHRVGKIPSREVQFLIIDKLSMVSSGLWTDIDSRLGEIFMTIPEKASASLSVMTVVALLQLPPVR